MASTEFRYDAEGDFQDISNYEDLFKDFLAHAGLDDGEVVVEDVMEGDSDDPIAFSVAFTVRGKTLTFRSDDAAEEWADTALVTRIAKDLGKVFGFLVEVVETGDQTAALRITT